MVRSVANLAKELGMESDKSLEAWQEKKMEEDIRRRRTIMTSTPSVKSDLYDDCIELKDTISTYRGTGKSSFTSSDITGTWFDDIKDPTYSEEIENVFTLPIKKGSK